MRVTKQSNYATFRHSRHEDYISGVETDLTTIFTALKGRLRFGSGTDNARGENISGEFQQFVTSGTANAEFTVAHGLSSTPAGYLITSSDAPGILYSSSTTANTSSIYFKCSVTTASFTVFLLK